MASGKRRNAVYIGILSIVLACLLAVSFLFFESHKSAIPLTLEITSNNVTETIKPWYDNDGKWYFFIPSYSSEDNTVLAASEGGCYLQSKLLSDKQALDSFEIGKEYAFEQHSRFADETATIIFLRSANVATMYIDTRSGSMKKVHVDKNNKENINMTLYGENGEQLYSGKEYADDIRGHGNATWEYEKKIV